MSIGTLQAKILLEDAQKVHYGSRDPVTGYIQLTFSPGTKIRRDSNPELFGPLELAVTFHGRAKTKLWKKQGNHTHIYRGRAPLFYRSQKLYNDSFRSRPADPVVIPFELYFPECTEATLGSGGWEATPRYAYGPGDPLPPSFSNTYYGFAHRYECFVEYRVGVEVAMPGIQVNIVKPEKEQEPIVYYERAHLPSPVADRPLRFRGMEVVKNELLLPEADRPTGFKQKAKAAFSSNYYPTYSFDWTCIAPQHLYIGQPIAIEVSIQPREKECTAVVIPEVHLTSFTVDVKAITSVRAERQLWSSPESYSDETKAFLTGTIDDNGPFSKANDWNKKVNTRELNDVPSEFQTYNIAQRYRMKIKGAFVVAGKTKEFSQESAIFVYPALLGGDAVAGASAFAEAGSSALPFDRNGVDATLPQYDRPPEYDEAVEEVPQSSSSPVGHGQSAS